MGYYVLDEIEKGDYKFSLDTFLGDPAANIVAGCTTKVSR